MLTAVQFCHILDFVLILPLAPMLMRELRIGANEFGILVSAYTFAAAATGLFAAAYMDRFDRKRMLLGLLAGFGLGTLLCGVATSYSMLLAGRIVAGAFGGVLAGVVFAIVGDSIRIERRATAMGVVMGAFSAASVLGLPFGLALAARTRWETPFLVLAGVTVVVLAGAAIALPRMRAHLEDGRPEGGAFAELWAVAREPHHLRAFALTVAIVFSGFIVIPFLSPYLVENVGLPERRLDLVYLVGGMATLVTGPLVFGPLADRFGHARVFRLAVLVAIIPVLAATHLPPVPLPAILVVTTAMMVFSSGRMISATALVTGVVEPRRRGSFMSLNASIQHGAAGAAALLAGMIVGGGEGGPLTGFPTVGILAVGASLVALRVVTALQPTADTLPPAPSSTGTPRARPALDPPSGLRHAAAGEDR